MTKAQERWKDIDQRIRKALMDIFPNPDYDWNQEPSQEVCAAAEQLVLTMRDFAKGKREETDVKDCYKAYVKMYQRQTEIPV